VFGLELWDNVSFIDLVVCYLAHTHAHTQTDTQYFFVLLSVTYDVTCQHVFFNPLWVSV